MKAGRVVARHESHVPGRSKCIAISGATGLVGSALTAFLRRGGHRVRRLVRAPAPDDPESIHYDVETGRVENAKFEEVDAVVHLAGEGIAARRWSPAQQARIRDSRVKGTRLIAETLAGLRNGPRTLVAASGGVLGRLLLPFRLGLGGRVGNGRQYMSWIGLDDLIGVIHHALVNEEICGPCNAVSPEPVTNAEFTRVLARVLRRPAILPVPAAAIRVALGEMGRELMLAGARVLPQRLRQSGFEFRHPVLEQALRYELGLSDANSDTAPRCEDG